MSGKEIPDTSQVGLDDRLRVLNGSSPEGGGNHRLSG